MRKTIKLKELCSFQEGYVNPPQGNPDYFDGEIKWIRAVDLNNSKVYTTTRTLTKKGFLSAKKSAILFSPGTIVISKSGTIGRLGLLQDYMCGNRATINIIPKEGTNIEYIFYNLLNRQTEIADLAVGSVQKNLYVSILENVDITIPSNSEQEDIVKLLKSIDEKIENNRQINDNLEQQAQALYKSWFVDFEPFKDSKFIESELGLIPEGWKVGKIKDIIRLLSGFPFKSSDFVQNGDYQLITIKGVQDGYLDVTSADRLSSFPPKMPQYCILNIGDILISLTGNVGRICIVDRNNLLLNQRVAILSPKNPRDSFYTYTMFRNELFKNELIHLARGTAQLNLSPIETGDKLAVIPPDSALEAFAKISKRTFEQYLSIKMENIRLSEMRDTLLPKLMSGELKINETDC